MPKTTKAKSKPSAKAAVKSKATPAAKATPKAKAPAKTSKITRSATPVARKVGVVKKTTAAAPKTAPLKKAALKAAPAKKPVAKKSPVKKAAPSGRISKPVKTAKPVKAVAAPVRAKLPEGAGFELVKQCVRALDDKKAEAVRVLHVGEKSSVTDYFIVATGNSEPHLRALRIAVEKELDAAKAVIVGRESQPESGWCVIDAFDVIVHLFLAGQRDNYEIESLWKTGEEVPVAELLK